VNRLYFLIRFLNNLFDYKLINTLQTWWNVFQILLIVPDAESASRHAIQVANALKKGGIFVVGHVFRGSADEDASRDDGQCPAVSAMASWTTLLVDKLRVKAFADLTVAPTMRMGVRQLVSCCSLSNLIVLLLKSLFCYLLGLLILFPIC